MKYVKNKKYLPILIVVFVVVIGALFLFRGGSVPALIGAEIDMTRLVRGSEASPNGFFSVPFLKDSEEYTFINVAVDLNKDGAIGSYLTGKETQEEWLVKNMRTRVSENVANSYSIFIPDKTIEERSDFSAYIVLGKNKLDGWDGHSASGGLLKEAKISAFGRMDYGPYYSPDPEGLRDGGFSFDWLTSGYVFADNTVPDVPPGLSAGVLTAETEFDVFHSDVPDINQETNECVPTAVANSLLWLAAKNNFTDKMPTGGNAGLISELKNDMKWKSNGVLREDVLSGINAFKSRHKIPIEAHQIGALFDIGIVSKIAGELKKGQDVEVGMEFGVYEADGSYHRVGGHMVTAVGAWAAGGSVFLGIHDPLSLGRDSLDMYEINGTRVTNYSLHGGTADIYTNIKYAIAESPQAETESVYKGTYEGEFNYEYKNRNSKGGGCEGKEGLTGWIPATLHARITFEPFAYGVGWDRYTVQTTKIWTDDPDFGTGAGGVTPPGLANASVLILPMIPRAENDPINYAMDAFATDKNSTRWDPLSNHGLRFDFPLEGGAEIALNSYAGEGYYVSPDGTALYSYPRNPSDPFMSSDTWSALNRNKTGTGPLSMNAQIGPNKKYCSPKFISWSLTKVSP